MDTSEDKSKKQKYEEDEREACKYGTKCYQKNANHLKKFKHPPKTKNENNEVTGKKRKSPEDSESSSSNTPKVKKLDSPSSDNGSNDKVIEDSKVDDTVTEAETNSSEVTKTDSSEVAKTDSSEDAKTDSSVAAKIDSEEVEKIGSEEITKIASEDVTKTDSEEVAKADSEEVTKADSEEVTKADSEEVTKTDSEEVTKTDFEEVTKNDAAMDQVTNDGTGTNTDEKTENSVTETPNEPEEPNKTNDVNNASDTVNSNKEKIDTEEKDLKMEIASTDDSADKKPETKVGKVEKIPDVKSEVNDTKEKCSEKLNDKEKTPRSANLSTKQKDSNVKSEILKSDDSYDVKKLIQKAFLVPMPSDFYKFYEFCKDVKPADPSTALKIAELKLVGPYDVLNGIITKEIVENTVLLTHWRYYYDPPEFQTVIKGNDREGLHFGYWRDRPSSDPVFVAINSSNVSHKIKPVAENIFGAVAYYLEERVKKATPFEKAGFFSLLGKLKSHAKKNNISLETQSDKMKQREKNVVARTIHGAGIVCPYNKKTQLGYRELSVTDNQLLKIVKKIDDATNEEGRLAARSELGEVVRLATIAGDECDFGTCLELGHDLLSTGCFHVQNAALAVLSIAYNQLDRQAFLQIVEAHMQNRKKSSNTSALENLLKE